MSIEPTVSRFEGARIRFDSPLGFDRVLERLRAAITRFHWLSLIRQLPPLTPRKHLKRRWDDASAQAASCCLAKSITGRGSRNTASGAAPCDGSLAIR